MGVSNVRVASELGEGTVIDHQILTQLVLVRADDQNMFAVPFEEITAFNLPKPEEKPPEITPEPPPAQEEPPTPAADTRRRKPRRRRERDNNVDPSTEKRSPTESSLTAGDPASTPQKPTPPARAEQSTPAETPAGDSAPAPDKARKQRRRRRRRRKPGSESQPSSGES